MPLEARSAYPRHGCVVSFGIGFAEGRRRLDLRLWRRDDRLKRTVLAEWLEDQRTLALVSVVRRALAIRCGGRGVLLLELLVLQCAGHRLRGGKMEAVMLAQRQLHRAPKRRRRGRR